MSRQRARRLSDVERGNLVMHDIRVAIAAAPVRTWEAHEAKLVLAAVQQIVRERGENVVLFPVAVTQR